MGAGIETRVDGIAQILLHLRYLHVGFPHQVTRQISKFGRGALKDLPTIGAHQLVQQAANRSARFLHVLWTQDDDGNQQNKNELRGADTEYFHG
jgi:hypothetical protein